MMFHWWPAEVTALAVMAVLLWLAHNRPTSATRITLAHCVCGKCFWCPDGWHGEDEGCECTPDCLLGDEHCPECGLFSVVMVAGEWPSCLACGEIVKVEG